MASTLCPSCGERIPHPSTWVVVVEQDDESGARRTRLIANRTLVVHMCTETDKTETDKEV
jgi:hypothetical protein